MTGLRVPDTVTSGVPDHPILGDASTPRGQLSGHPRGSVSQPAYRWTGVPVIGPRVSSTVDSGVPDHPTLGDASTWDVGSPDQPPHLYRPRRKGLGTRHQPRCSAVSSTRSEATLQGCNASGIDYILSSTKIYEISAIFNHYTQPFHLTLENCYSNQTVNEPDRLKHPAEIYRQRKKTTASQFLIRILNKILLYFRLSIFNSE